MLDIIDIQEANKACKSCSLCTMEHHIQVVPGIGPEDAKLMIVAEAPGQDENLMGEPLVGRSGKLLDKILETSTIRRAEVYISNVVKCRPPNNRPPTEDEISVCKGWLWQEIQTIQPKFIVTLGMTSSRLLLKSKETMANLFGQEFTLPYCNATLIPMYHPSYLLRKGASDKVVQPCVDVFKKIKERL